MGSSATPGVTFAPRTVLSGVADATTTVTTIDGILGWANGLADKLKEARKELPDLEKKIKAEGKRG